MGAATVTAVATNADGVMPSDSRTHVGGQWIGDAICALDPRVARRVVVGGRE